jgi:hypothetical protein
MRILYFALLVSVLKVVCLAESFRTIWAEVPVIYDRVNLKDAKVMDVCSYLEIVFNHDEDLRLPRASDVLFPVRLDVSESVRNRLVTLRTGRMGLIDVLVVLSAVGDLQLRDVSRSGVEISPNSFSGSLRVGWHRISPETILVNIHNSGERPIVFNENIWSYPTAYLSGGIWNWLAVKGLSESSIKHFMLSPGQSIDIEFSVPPGDAYVFKVARGDVVYGLLLNNDNRFDPAR